MTSIFTGHDQGVRPHGTPSSGMPTPGGATAVLDRHLRFTGWSREAEELFGLASEEVLGRSADAVLADTETGAGISSAAGDGGTAWSLGPRPVRRGDGRPVPVSLSLTPLALGVGATGWLLVAVDSELAHWEALGRAMLDGLDRESPVQLVIYDTDARVRWINAAIEKQFGISLKEVAGRLLKDILPQGEVLEEADRPVTSVEEIVQRVARTGSPVVDVRYRSATFLAPHHERVWSCSYFRLQDEEGRPIGVCEAGLDITDRYVARQRLALLSRASGSIGRTLDIRHTAGELAELVVPEFAEAVIVDIFEPVLGGEEPQHFGTHPTLCRVAHRTDHTAAKDTAYDELDTVSLRCLAENAPATDAATHVLALPLKARGTTLGVAAFARPQHADPFEHEEIQLAEELVSRTAVCLDNARRYTREHATALMLQRDLLPRALPEQPGVEVAHRYLPAAGHAGVGGDWYDVIPLSGARVGLVVGDVAGHGMGAAATMGRVRTTVAALAALDLAPDELLARLDDLVARTGIPTSGAAEAETEDQALGVTCLYAIYDPVSRHCVMARAGHLPPVLVTPDGHTELVDLPAGPPLGLGGLPFECAEHRAAGRRHARSVHRRTRGKPSDRHRRRDPISLHRTLRARERPTGQDLRQGHHQAPAPSPRGRCRTAAAPRPRPGRESGRRRGHGLRRRQKWQEPGRWPSTSWPRGESTKPRRSSSSSSSASWSPTRSAMATLRWCLRLIQERGTHRRGLRRRPHLAPPSAGGDGRRGRPRSVPGCATDTTLGNPVHVNRQDHLDRGAACRRPNCREPFLAERFEL